MIKFSSKRPHSLWRVWGTTYLVLSMRLLWMVGRGKIKRGKLRLAAF